MFFARNMAIMSRAGIQPFEVLKALKRQTTSKTFLKILDDLTAAVINGQFLSDGLRRYQRIFGEFFINIIRVGEVSGSLSDNLDYLAEALRKKQELESKVKGALIYPAVILCATMGITGTLTFFVFPKILPIFKSLRIELPLITEIFIFVATFLIDNGIYVGIGLVVFVVGFFFLLRLRPVRYAFDRVLITLPIAGTMVKNYNMVSFARSLAILLKSGIRIVEAFNITSNSVNNLVYKKKLREIGVEAGHGESISKFLAVSPKLFPGVFTEMIAIGEKTGKLNDTAIYLADFYESELDASTKSMTNILEPLLLVVMGCIVTFVALAIIIPIYEVSSAVQR